MNTAETDAIALAYKQMSAHPEYLGDFVILKENQSLIFVRKDESGDLLVTLKEVYDLSKEKLNNFTEFDFEKSIQLIGEFNTQESNGVNFSIYKLDENMTKLIKVTPMHSLLYNLCNKRDYLSKVDDILLNINNITRRDKKMENQTSILKEESTMKITMTAEEAKVIRMGYDSMINTPTFCGEFIDIGEKKESFIFIRKNKENGILATLKKVYNLAEEKINDFVKFDLEKSIKLIDDLAEEVIPNGVNFSIYNLDANMTKLIKVTPIYSLLYNIRSNGEYLSKVNEIFDRADTNYLIIKEEPQNKIDEVKKKDVKDSPKEKVAKKEKEVKVVPPSSKGATQALFGGDNNVGNNVANFTQQPQLPQTQQHPNNVVIPRELRLLHNLIDFDSFNIINDPSHVELVRRMINSINKEMVGYRKDTKESFYTSAFNKFEKVVQKTGMFTFYNVFKTALVFKAQNGMLFSATFPNGIDGDVYIDVLKQVAPAQSQ